MIWLLDMHDKIVIVGSADQSLLLTLIVEL